MNQLCIADKDVLMSVKRFIAAYGVQKIEIEAEMFIDPSETKFIKRKLTGKATLTIIGIKL